jgi:hypothetical protein
MGSALENCCLGWFWLFVWGDRISPHRAKLASNLRFYCLCFPTAENTGMHQQAWLLCDSYPRLLVSPLVVVGMKIKTLSIMCAPSVAWSVYFRIDPLAPLHTKPEPAQSISCKSVAHTQGYNLSPGAENSTWLLSLILSLQLLLYHTSLPEVHLLKAIKITQCPDFNPPATMPNIFHF